VSWAHAYALVVLSGIPSPGQPHTPREAPRLNKAAMAALGCSFRS
jgi:hypothetical protein